VSTRDTPKIATLPGPWGRGGLSPYALLVQLVAAVLRPDASRQAVERGAVAAWSGVHGLAHLAVNGVLDASTDLDGVVADVVGAVRQSLSRER